MSKLNVRSIASAVFVPAFLLLGIFPGNALGSVHGRGAERDKMVRVQIKQRGIKDPKVLAAMRIVPRHLFVPERYRNHAYYDQALPIDRGQTISQPYIVALMTELLEVDKESKVLEIGTGSGYQAAILAEIVSEVYTIEIISALHEKAAALLKRLGYENVFSKAGDGYLGWPEHAPFDGIVVTAAPDHVPEPLKEQLKVGGRMVIPVGARYQELMVITRQEEGFVERKVRSVKFVPMVGLADDRK